MFSVFFIAFAQFSEAAKEDEQKKKKCVPVEPEEMLKRFSDESYFLKYMYIFDIRPYRVVTKGKQVQQSRLIGLNTLDSAAMYRINWRGRNAYLVGENTDSAMGFCSQMIGRDFITEDIYVLKGGINAWTGPLYPRFDAVKCGVLTYSEVVSIMDSGRIVEFVDLRSRKNFNKGHIPDAVRGDAINEDRMYLNERSPLWARLRDENGVVIFIGNTEFEASHRCRSARMGSGLDIIYVLRGNMRGWEGDLEKEKLEILKQRFNFTE